MSDHPTNRRYCLMKRQNAYVLGDYAIASFWQHKQEAEPGTPLAATFPFYELLAAAWYTTKEDLEGADARELSYFAGLSQRDAEAVLAAYATL